jgi:DNA excision repair protein ERCC-2
LRPGPAPLRVSVTELVARAGSGGLALAAPGAAERMALGSWLHRQHQESARARDPSYRSEVRLAATVDHDGRALRIEGRADGLRRGDDGRTVVQELKSAAGAGPRCGERLALERLQVELYAWLLAREGGETPGAEILWLATAADGIRVVAQESVAVDLPAIERRLGVLLEGVVADARRQEARATGRRGLADGLRFPFASERPGQRTLEAAVEGALDAGRHLLLEAPTGIGKTVAVLLPALRHAFNGGDRVLLLTSRGSQQRGALAALELLAPPGSAAAAALRPKAELCASGTLLCHEDHCAFARGYGRKVAEGRLLEQLLADPPVLRPERVLATGRAAEACPHALSRAAAREASVTVADYNYVLDPAVTLPELGPRESLEGVVLLLDEAHQVPDRARDARSAVLARETLLAIAARAAAGGAPVHDAVREAARALAAGLDAIAEEAAGGETGGDGEIEWELGAETLAGERHALAGALARYLEYRFESGTLEAGDPILAGGRELASFGAALEAAGPGYATSLGWRRGAPRLRVVCLEPERELAALFARCRAVVAFSATLQPFALRRELLGLDADRTDCLALPAPFPRERRAVVIDARADTRLRARSREAPRLARKLARFAASVPGHVLALAPSFAWIDALRAHLRPADRLVLAQAPGDGPAERERLLGALASREAPPVLLLAAAGGFFGEGVEWPGSLAGVAVLGPCLPPPDLVRELLRRRYEERFGDGFTCAYALPGMLRVVQGAGRLIRSEHDRGVVALYDRRFLEEPFRSLLPPDWLAGGAPEDLVGDPARVARRFFGPEDASGPGLGGRVRD